MGEGWGGGGEGEERKKSRIPGNHICISKHKHDSGPLLPLCSKWRERERKKLEGVLYSVHTACPSPSFFCQQEEKKLMLTQASPPLPPCSWRVQVQPVSMSFTLLSLAVVFATKGGGEECSAWISVFIKRQPPPDNISYNLKFLSKLGDWTTGSLKPLTVRPPLPTHTVPKVIDFPRFSIKCSGENEILRGIFHL